MEKLGDVWATVPIQTVCKARPAVIVVGGRPTSNGFVRFKLRGCWGCVMEYMRTAQKQDFTLGVER